MASIQIFGEVAAQGPFGRLLHDGLIALAQCCALLIPCLSQGWARAREAWPLPSAHPQSRRMPLRAGRNRPPPAGQKEEAAVGSASFQRSACCMRLMPIGPLCLNGRGWLALWVCPLTARGGSVFAPRRRRQEWIAGDMPFCDGISVCGSGTLARPLVSRRRKVRKLKREWFFREGSSHGVCESGTK